MDLNQTSFKGGDRLNKIYVLGIGPGSEDYLLPITRKKIRDAEILIGSKRALDLFLEGDQRKIEFKSNLPEIKDFIAANYQRFKIAILVTGDSGFFSLLTYLKEYFTEEEIKVIPGISSIQLLFAHSRICWQDAKFVSLHGRDQRRELLAAVKNHRKVGVLTDSKNTPDRIASFLMAEGLGDREIIVGEDLSYPSERISRGQAKEISLLKFAHLAVMLIYDRDNSKRPVNNWPYQSPGISDSEFVRGSLPMTKAEVRALTIAKLRPKKESIIYDIGAGTGSLTIEAALLADQGHVYAIERKLEGIDLIRLNLERFGVHNVKLIHGEAPEAIRNLPPADRVIIGGSGKRFKEIFMLLDKTLLLPGARVVINLVTFNTLSEVYQLLNEMNYKYEICQLSVAKGSKLGDYELFKAMNPVFVITAVKEINEKERCVQ